MNRYAVRGIAGDVTAGRAVVVVSATAPLARLAFEAVCDAVPSLGRVVQARQRIVAGTHGLATPAAAPGRAWFVSRRQVACGVLRGHTVDVVVLDDVEATDPDVQVLRDAGAEVIRA